METSSQLGRGTTTAGTDSGANGPAPKEGGACNKERPAVVGTVESSQECGVGGSGGGFHGPPSKRHADLTAMEDGDGVGGDPKKRAQAGVEAGEGGEPSSDGTSRGGGAGGSAKVLSDDPPPGQSDASCAHLVRAGLDEGVDRRGRPVVEPEVQHLVSAMRKTWWECAAAVANALAKYGSEVEDAFQMEQRSITKNLNGIKSALEKGKPVQSISPAFEWAQSGDWIYINAKMSHKLDAPATLNVVSEGVKMGERSLEFAASRDQKRFSLSLALHADIDPDPSTISFGSVGRVTFTLKKAKSGVKWPRLLDEDQKKPVNMHVWWAKQEEFSDELDGLEEAAADKASKAAKAAADGDKDKDAAAAAAAVDDAEAAAAAAAAAAAGAAAEATPMSSERRLAKAKKDAATGLSKEKKARVEELEKERRAVIKSIDTEAAAKKKQAEDAHTARKTMVEEDFDELVKKRHAEIVADHAEAKRSEL